MTQKTIMCPNCKFKTEVPNKKEVHFAIGVCQKCRKIFYSFMGVSRLLGDVDIFNTSNEELRDEVVQKLHKIVTKKISNLFEYADFRKNVLQVFEKLAKEDIMDISEEFDNYEDIVDEFEDGYQEGFADGASIEYSEKSGKMEESFDDIEEVEMSEIVEDIMSKINYIEEDEETPNQEPKKIPDREVELFLELLNGNSTVQHLIDIG